MIEAAKRSDIALDFAGVRISGKDFGTISRRSSTCWQIRANGKAGHSSGIFGQRGDGAIYELVRILNAFRNDLREEYLTYNVGVIVGGDQAKYDSVLGTGTASGKDNIIPQVAIADGDIRTISDEQLQRVRQKMKAIVAQHLPATGAEISFEEGYPSMPPTDGNRKLLGVLNSINRDLGLPDMEPLDPLQRGAGDISFISQYVDGLAGMGAVGGVRMPKANPSIWNFFLASQEGGITHLPAYTVNPTAGCRSTRRTKPSGLLPVCLR
ncbi:MAG: peptidase dimerization domain-containing protein [Bryobacteraceae bacterium]